MRDKPEITLLPENDELLLEVPKSERKRVFWRKGQPHPLDVIPDHVEQLNGQLPQEVGPFMEQTQTLQHLAEHLSLEELLTSMKAADTYADETLFQRFGDRKHQVHFAAYFAWLRRKRVIALLRLSTTLLQLVNQVLQALQPLLQIPDITLPDPEELSEEFTDEASLALQRRKGVEGHVLASPPDGREQERMKGIEGKPIEVVPGLKTVLRLLAEFEKQLPKHKEPLSIGRGGWIEVRFVPKHYPRQNLYEYLKNWQTWQTEHIPIPEKVAEAIPPEVRELIAQGNDLEEILEALLQLPKALRLQLFSRAWRGPYVRFRWRTAGKSSMISLAGPKDYPKTNPLPFDPEKKQKQSRSRNPPPAKT